MKMFLEAWRDADFRQRLDMAEAFLRIFLMVTLWIVAITFLVRLYMLGLNAI